MPLPSLRLHGAKQCRARSKKSGNQCLNLAAFGMPTCRMHGARRSHSTLRGADHPSYRHGKETLESKAMRSIKLSDLRALERLMYQHGLLNDSIE